MSNEVPKSERRPVEAGAQMKHVHVRPQQNGWTVLSVEVCCSRIGEGFGSARQPVGRWGGWKLRPPKPALASPAHRGAERNGSSTLHSSLEPTRARRWDGGGQSRAASQEWRASPSGTGWGVALCGRQAPSGEGPTPAGSQGSGADRDGQRCFASRAIGVGGFHPLQE